MEKHTDNTINKDYWEKNIEKYSGFYYITSEEQINIPFGLSGLYKKFIFPLERKVTLERYNIVCAFIDKHVKPGMKVADIGCGSGIFSKKMLDKGAHVYAMDYVHSAVELTKKNLSSDTNIKNLQVSQLDITKHNIPVVDVAISIGVVPYISEVGIFFDNILPYTDKALFNYNDKNNIFNITRRVLSFLDVRHYSFHSQKQISSLIAKHGFTIVENRTLGTGFILELKKK
ncbi:MAG: methyltransferase domain-containing protein [Bacteroidetes bacterium]|nr:methyltransferase domain-containing protein [Bacteroidota bacterium]